MLNVKKQVYRGTNETTQKVITEEVLMDNNEIYECIIKAFKEQGIFNVDAIKILCKTTYEDQLYICVSYCGIKIAICVKNNITYEEFINYVNRLAEIASYKVFDINDPEDNKKDYKLAKLISSCILGKVQSKNN